MEKKAKIIIIDDNPDFRFIMETLLRRNGYATVSAEDGRKGLALIEKEVPDLILLDVIMEDTFSGLELCKRVRTHQVLRKIPIIGLSGIGDELGVHLDRWGDEEYFDVDEYYEKPVSPELLLERIGIRLENGVLQK
jgi:CheY-like chemotaxis protein